MHRAAALPRVRALPRPPRPLLWIAAALAAVALTFLLVRDSSLVRVQDVAITGLSGPEAVKVRARLTDAARDMTTLHVDEEQLRVAVEPYPIVKDLRVSTDFPHGLRIAVREHVPVAVVVAGGRRTPVAGDGTLLEGAAPRRLPVVQSSVMPAGDRLGDRSARTAVRTLAAAPAALRSRIRGVRFTRADGFVFAMTAGPELRFGAADRIAAKWAAAAVVLADRSSRGATYLDVRYPERPAAGGLEDPAKQMSPEAVNDASPEGIAPGVGEAAALAP